LYSRIHDEFLAPLHEKIVDPEDDGDIDKYHNRKDGVYDRPIRCMESFKVVGGIDIDFVVAGYFFLGLGSVMDLLREVEECLVFFRRVVFD